MVLGVVGTDSRLLWSFGLAGDWTEPYLSPYASLGSDLCSPMAKYV